MKTTMTITLLITLISYLGAQETNPILKPQFKGGQHKLEAYLNQNLQYPESAKRQGQEGLVKVNVQIDEEGKIGAIKVVKSMGKALDQEAMRLIREMPDWIPAKRNDCPIAIKYQLAIRFELD